MKILFLSDNFPPEVNAAASRVYERACYWARGAHDVSIITCAPNFPLGKLYEGYKNKWVHQEIKESMTIIRVKSFMAPNKGFVLRTLDFLSYMVMAILVGAFKAKPDIIVATSPQFFAAVGGWILARIKRVPFVFEIGDLWPESIKGLGLMGDSVIYRSLERLELFLYRHSEGIIAQTPAFKENLITRGISPNKIKVILNGVDVNKFSPLPRKEKKILLDYDLKEKFVVGYIGTHGLAHDLTQVLRAAKVIAKTHKNIVFVFVGEGAEKKDLIAYAKSNTLQNVQFIPLQPKSEIKKWWSVCDVALLSLKNEEVFTTVIPSKTFEAAAMGLPIVLVAPEGEASRFIQKEKCGLCVLPDSPETLARCLIDLSQDHSLQEHFKKNSLKTAQNYSREKQAKDFIEHLRNTLSFFTIHKNQKTSRNQ